MRTLSLSEVDGAEWNLFVERAQDSHYLQSYEAALVEESSERRFLISDDVRGQLLIHRFGPLAIGEMKAGPVWRPGAVSALDEFAVDLLNTCRDEGLAFCRVGPFDPSGQMSAGSLARELKWVWSYWNPPRVVMTVQLNGNKSQTSSSFRMKSRRAKSRGVIVEESGKNGIEDLARLMDHMSERKAVASRGGEHYRRLKMAFGDRAHIFCAKHDGATIAAALVITFGDASHFVYGAFDYGSRQLYPNELMHSEIMEWSRSRGLARYELGGSCTSWPPSESEPGYGVYRFKRGLGAELRLRGAYLDVFPRPATYHAYTIAESIGLPLVAERWSDKMRVSIDRLRNR